MQCYQSTEDQIQSCNPTGTEATEVVHLEIVLKTWRYCPRWLNKRPFPYETTQSKQKVWSGSDHNKSEKAVSLEWVCPLLPFLEFSLLLIMISQPFLAVMQAPKLRVLLGFSHHLCPPDYIHTNYIISQFILLSRTNNLLHSFFSLTSKLVIILLATFLF